MENKDLQKLARSLRFTQICCLISSLLTGALIVALVVVFMQAKPVLAFVDTLGPAVDNVSKIDVQAANNALRIFNQEAVNIDWKQVSTTVNTLDVKAINQAVNDLDVVELNQKLAAIDVDELNKSLENLNAAAESLKKLSVLFGR
jgi:hypothetical protein